VAFIAARVANITMRFFVGTSAFSESKWKGSFYPKKLPQKEMLRYYAERFNAVEINSTYYRMPSARNLKSWLTDVPKGFQFAFKAPQAITHFKRLKDTEEPTQKFFRETAILNAQRGPLLFGLPPNFQKDTSRLREFLRQLPRRTKVAFEFRHASWFDDETFDCLRASGCALCINDGEESPWTDLVGTADWGYLRLRRQSYTNRRLADWIKKLRAQKWRDAYIFFKHEATGTGPKFAARFLKLAGT
jgi:uncharacterized protein YecE (DUF72 family)